MGDLLDIGAQVHHAKLAYCWFNELNPPREPFYRHSMSPYSASGSFATFPACMCVSD